jgi:hypothetical protein
VRRPLAGRAEVAGRAYQPFAEMKLPNPVDNDARGERVGGVAQPFGQLEAAAPLAVFPADPGAEGLGDLKVAGDSGLVDDSSSSEGGSAPLPTPPPLGCAGEAGARTSAG